MPFENNFHIKKSFVIKGSFVRFSFIVVILLFSFSCKKKERSNNEDYSNEFKVILNNLNKVPTSHKSNEDILYLDSAFNRINNPTLNDRFRFYAFHFVYYKKKAHDARQELLYADSMIDLAQKGINEDSYFVNIAEANFAKGDAYFDLRQYNDAYKCFYQGYFIGKNHLNNSVLAGYTYRMGMIMFRQSHYLSAAIYFKESYRQSFAYHDDFRTFYQRQELLNDIGESYQHNDNADSASLYFNKTLDYINKNNERFKSYANMLNVARAVTYGDQGRVLYKAKQYSQSADLFKKSIVINLKKDNDNTDAEMVEINLGQLYLDNHKNGLFIHLMQNLRLQLDSVKNIEAETNWNKLMSNYYYTKKDIPRAFKYLNDYDLLKDSLVQQSIYLKETDVTQQLANYNNQYQIQNLTNDNNLQHIYLYVAITGGAMAVIIIILIYRNWKRSKNEVTVVNTLNKQINLQKINLEKTLNELKISSEEKDRILRTVAHDLRNPIGGIVSLTGLMLDDELNEEQKALIKLINSTSYNSLELINEILEATTASGTLNKELIDINSLVNNSVEILSFKASEKDQHIVTELLAEPKKLYINQEKIWRVISNLISNAIKFSPNDAFIKVKVISTENEIIISVSDNGIGIPDSIKDQVFNIFTNAKRLGTAGEKSFGLGLSISQQIIQDHKGRIWFENNPDQGTTFYISLLVDMP